MGSVMGVVGAVCGEGCGVEGRRGSGKFGGDVAVSWSWVGQMWRTVRVEGVLCD